MSFFDIQTTLDKRLSDAGLPLPIAWEGTNYKPTKGQAFIRPTNLSATSSQLNLKNDAQRNVGIYQVDVFSPLDGTGTGRLLRIVDELKQHFKSQTELDNDVYIREVSRLPMFESEKSWLICGIQITYVSYS